MPEYTVKKLRELREEFYASEADAHYRECIRHNEARPAPIEQCVDCFLEWLSSRESKRQKGDVSRSFGSKGQEVE